MEIGYLRPKMTDAELHFSHRARNDESTHVVFQRLNDIPRLALHHRQLSLHNRRRRSASYSSQTQKKQETPSIANTHIKHLRMEIRIDRKQLP